MKIAIVLEDFSIGGAQRVVSELVQNIDAQVNNVKVFCVGSRKDTKLARDAESKVDIVYLDAMKMRNMKSFINVFRALMRYRPDVINAHLGGQLYAIPFGTIFRIPTIITVHTKPQKAFYERLLFLVRWGLKHTKLSLVAVSEENMKLVKEYFHINDSRVCCINNGINIESFYRHEHKRFTFINVARQDDNKNQAAILRAFAEIYRSNRNLRLVLVGDGPCHEQLQEMCRELNVQNAVDLPGSVDNVADYYAVSDVYVQASHREAMPMSVLEAMAAGLPILSSDVGGLRDVVKDNGYLYPDDQEQDLLRYMCMFSEMHERCLCQMGAASRKNVEPYSSKAMAEKYLELYKQIVNR